MLSPIFALQLLDEKKLVQIESLYDEFQTFDKASSMWVFFPILHCFFVFCVFKFLFLIFSSVQLQKFYKFGTTDDAMSGTDSHIRLFNWLLDWLHFCISNPPVDWFINLMVDWLIGRPKSSYHIITWNSSFSSCDRRGGGKNRQKTEEGFEEDCRRGCPWAVGSRRCRFGQSHQGACTFFPVNFLCQCPEENMFPFSTIFSRTNSISHASTTPASASWCAA